MTDRSIPQLEDTRTIALKRSKYSITAKLSWRQRIASRFCEAIALVAIAATVAAIVASAAMPALLPIPA